MERADGRMSLLAALPLAALPAPSFVAPLAVAALFSVMPQGVLGLAHLLDVSAYAVSFPQGHHRSGLWSLGMAPASTVILLVIFRPLAFGMARISGRFALVLTVAVVTSLFVSEDIRPFGWVPTPTKGGLVEGRPRAWTGVDFDGTLRDPGIIVTGLVRVLLPFMPFPLAQGRAMAPDDARRASSSPRALAGDTAHDLRLTSLTVAAPVTAVSVVVTLGARALARDRWRHRTAFRKLIPPPISFPWPCSGWRRRRGSTRWASSRPGGRRSWRISSGSRPSRRRSCRSAPTASTRRSRRRPATWAPAPGPS